MKAKAHAFVFLLLTGSLTGYAQNTHAEDYKVATAIFDYIFSFIDFDY